MTPGNRLRRARRLNGFKSRREFSAHIQATDNHISYSRLGRLERDEDNPSIEEINIICRLLNMSADWWLMGKDISSAVIFKRLDGLSEKKKRFVLLIIDEINFGLDEGV